MTKFSTLALASILGMALMTTTVTAGDAVKGQKLYSKKLKDSCKMTGGDFASKHSQDEWEEINEAKKMGEEITKICGEGVSIKEKLVPYIYDFVYEFANDSGNVPSC